MMTVSKFKFTSTLPFPLSIIAEESYFQIEDEFKYSEGFSTLLGVGLGLGILGITALFNPSVHAQEEEISESEEYESADDHLRTPPNSPSPKRVIRSSQSNIISKNEISKRISMLEPPILPIIDLPPSLVRTTSISFGYAVDGFEQVNNSSKLITPELQKNDKALNRNLLNISSRFRLSTYTPSPPSQFSPPRTRPSSPSPSQLFPSSPSEFTPPRTRPASISSPPRSRSSTPIADGQKLFIDPWSIQSNPIIKEELEVEPAISPLPFPYKVARRPSTHEIPMAIHIPPSPKAFPPPIQAVLLPPIPLRRVSDPVRTRRFSSIFGIKPKDVGHIRRESITRSASNEAISCLTWKSSQTVENYEKNAQKFGTVELKRQEIIFELIATEKLFIEGLSKIKLLPAKGLEMVPIIIIQFVKDLEKIKLLHREISTALETLALGNESENEIVAVEKFVEALLPFTKKLVVYQGYLNRFEKVTSVIREHLIDPTSTFGKYLRLQSLSSDLSGMSLESHLLKPAQRLMKYPLFFKQLHDLSTDSVTTPSTTSNRLLLLLTMTRTMITALQELKLEEDQKLETATLLSKIKGHSLEADKRYILSQGRLLLVTLTESDQKKIIKNRNGLVSGTDSKLKKIKTKSSKKSDIVVFLFSDLLILTTIIEKKSPFGNRSSKPYKVMSTDGQSRVISVNDISGATEHERLIQIDITTFTKTISTSPYPPLSERRSVFFSSSSSQHDQWLNSFKLSSKRAASPLNAVALSRSPLFDTTNTLGEAGAQELWLAKLKDGLKENSISKIESRESLDSTVSSSWSPSDLLKFRRVEVR